MAEANFSSNAAAEKAKKAQEARDAGMTRKQERDARRQESRETWSKRWNTFKEKATQAWETVRDVPANLVDGADNLRTRAEAGAQELQANLIEKANQITNSAASKMEGMAKFIDALPERARAKYAELKLQALQAAAREIKSMLEAVQNTIQQAEVTPGEEVVTKADAIKKEAETHREKSKEAAEKSTKFSGVRNWLKGFAA